MKIMKLFLTLLCAITTIPTFSMKPTDAKDQLNALFQQMLEKGLATRVAGDYNATNNLFGTKISASFFQEGEGKNFLLNVIRKIALDDTQNVFEILQGQADIQFEKRARPKAWKKTRLETRVNGISAAFKADAVAFVEAEKQAAAPTIVVTAPENQAAKPKLVLSEKVDHSELLKRKKLQSDAPSLRPDRTTPGTEKKVTFVPESEITAGDDKAPAATQKTPLVRVARIGKDAASESQEQSFSKVALAYQDARNRNKQAEHILHTFFTPTADNPYPFVSDIYKQLGADSCAYATDDWPIIDALSKNIVAKNKAGLKATLMYFVAPDRRHASNESKEQWDRWLEEESNLIFSDHPYYANLRAQMALYGEHRQAALSNEQFKHEWEKQHQRSKTITVYMQASPIADTSNNEPAQTAQEVTNNAREETPANPSATPAAPTNQPAPPAPQLAKSFTLSQWRRPLIYAGVTFAAAVIAVGIYKVAQRRKCPADQGTKPA